MMSIIVQDVYKSYGTHTALQGISFEAKAGEIIGFLGPNGAGKSTTMRILTGYLEASSGTVQIQGETVRPDSVATKKHIGYLAENNPLYLEMYVKEFLSFLCDIHGFSASKRKGRIQACIEAVGLQEMQHKKIGALSKGYRQRVGLAQAILHDPALLILDEPTTGLDPNQLIEIRELIKSLGKNKTVLLSTHIMQEVEAICDRILVIHQGKIVADATKDAILAQGLRVEDWFISLTSS